MQGDATRGGAEPSRAAGRAPHCPPSRPYFRGAGGVRGDPAASPCTRGGGVGQRRREGASTAEEGAGWGAAAAAALFLLLPQNADAAVRAPPRGGGVAEPPVLGGTARRAEICDAGWFSPKKRFFHLVLTPRPARRGLRACGFLTPSVAEPGLTRSRRSSGGRRSLLLRSAIRDRS